MRILFEDSEIIVIAKDALELVHEAPGCEAPIIADELKRIYPEIADVGSSQRPGVVHRLDLDTSGVMVFARTAKAYIALRRQFESHKDIEKIYLAVCHGAPEKVSGRIEGPVGREHKFAVTNWQVLSKKNGVSLIEFKIETGRMHQIRIHAAELGCPIAGDLKYGNKALDRSMRRRPKRTLLHAAIISFIHPLTHRRVEFSCPPPEDIIYAI